MSSFAFRNSQASLSTVLFWVELSASVIEVILAFAAVRVLSRNATPETQNTGRHLTEWFAVVAAVSLALVVMENRRLTTLQNQKQSLQEQQTQGHLATNDAQIAQTSDKVNGLSHELANAKELVLPRVLTPEKRLKLIEAARPFPAVKVEICSSIGDDEGQDFAEEISEALNSAGWKSVTYRSMNSRPLKGIVIFLHDFPNPSGIAIANALGGSGFLVGMSQRILNKRDACSTRNSEL